MDKFQDCFTACRLDSSSNHLAQARLLLPFLHLYRNITTLEISGAAIEALYGQDEKGHHHLRKLVELDLQTFGQKIKTLKLLDSTPSDRISQLLVPFSKLEMLDIWITSNSKASMQLLGTTIAKLTQLKSLVIGFEGSEDLPESWRRLGLALESVVLYAPKWTSACCWRFVSQFSEVVGRLSITFEQVVQAPHEASFYFSPSPTTNADTLSSTPDETPTPTPQFQTVSYAQLHALDITEIHPPANRIWTLKNDLGFSTFPAIQRFTLTSPIAYQSKTRTIHNYITWDELFPTVSQLCLHQPQTFISLFEFLSLKDEVPSGDVKPRPNAFAPRSNGTLSNYDRGLVKEVREREERWDSEDVKTLLKEVLGKVEKMGQDDDFTNLPKWVACLRETHSFHENLR